MAKWTGAFNDPKLYSVNDENTHIPKVEPEDSQEPTLTRPERYGSKVETRIGSAGRREPSLEFQDETETIMIDSGSGIEPIEDDEDLLLQPFGRYTLIRRVAFGGMGEVFLAQQNGLGGFEKLLIIKRLLPHYHADADVVRMFFEEARLQGLMTSPNIAQVFDMGSVDGKYFIALEFVHGPSWRELIARMRELNIQISPAHAVELAVQLCRGLTYAHNLKDAENKSLFIVHRDINPHNILLNYEGECKIIDFGIAKSSLNEVHTAAGTIKGKYAYMSPEQSRAEPVDRRSDIFSFGICLYELLTLQNPFSRENLVLSLEAIGNLEPPGVENMRPELAFVSPIIERCIAKNPDDRFADASEIVEAVTQLYDDGFIEAPTQSVSDWLRLLFAEERSNHQHLLQTMGSGAGLRPSSRADSALRDSSKNPVAQKGAPIAHASSHRVAHNIAPAMKALAPPALTPHTDVNMLLSDVSPSAETGVYGEKPLFDTGAEDPTVGLAMPEPAHSTALPPVQPPIAAQPDTSTQLTAPLGPPLAPYKRQSETMLTRPAPNSQKKSRAPLWISLFVIFVLIAVPALAMGLLLYRTGGEVDFSGTPLANTALASFLEDKFGEEVEPVAGDPLDEQKPPLKRPVDDKGDKLVDIADKAAADKAAADKAAADKAAADKAAADKAAADKVAAADKAAADKAAADKAAADKAAADKAAADKAAADKAAADKAAADKAAADKAQAAKDARAAQIAKQKLEAKKRQDQRAASLRKNSAAASSVGKLSLSGAARKRLSLFAKKRARGSFKSKNFSGRISATGDGSSAKVTISTKGLAIVQLGSLSKGKTPVSIPIKKGESKTVILKGPGKTPETFRLSYK